MPSNGLGVIGISLGVVGGAEDVNGSRGEGEPNLKAKLLLLLTIS